MAVHAAGLAGLGFFSLWGGRLRCDPGCRMECSWDLHQGSGEEGRESEERKGEEERGGSRIRQGKKSAAVQSQWRPQPT